MNTPEHETLPFSSEYLSKFDPFGVFESMKTVQQAWLQEPAAMMEKMSLLTNSMLAVNQQFTAQMMGIKIDDYEPVVPYDERFQDPIWKENPAYDFIKEVYLLQTHWIENLIYDAPDVPEKTRRRAAFWTRQGLNALAPSNYYWTNPVAIWKSVATGGESLRNGMKLLQQDMQIDDVSMVDQQAFEVGKDVANTAGAVVFRNDMLEVIQYKATTKTIHETPIFIVAPWINKYYILDLNQRKSLVRYMVDKGFNVFITSWKNPDESMRDTSFEDYMLKGVLEGVEAIQEITDQQQIHAVGYCIGGTLLSTVMAWLNRSRTAKSKLPIASWSLFTTLVDFTDPGDIDAFITEDGIKMLEEKMAESGYLDGKDMSWSFRLLRSNGLLWNYVVNSYLYGEEPAAIDVLAWNTDNTRMPAEMHSYYLRELYLENKLVQPDALVIKGRSIDLGKITQPLYAIGTEQDHIAPWKETFKIAELVSGPVQYTLATAGHILGIVNPPVEPPKRRYWTGDATGQTDADSWLENVEKVPGSWWDDWSVWLAEQCGKLVDAKEPGSEKHPALIDAPGTYVLEK